MLRVNYGLKTRLSMKITAITLEKNNLENCSEGMGHILYLYFIYYRVPVDP